MTLTPERIEEIRRDWLDCEKAIQGGVMQPWPATALAHKACGDLLSAYDALSSRDAMREALVKSRARLAELLADAGPFWGPKDCKLHDQIHAALSPDAPRQKEEG